jgi:hypothetical protein
MPAPTWSVGQVLTASDVNGWFVPLAAYKTSDTGRTTVTLTADPDLSIAVAANAFYKVDAQLYYKSTTGGTDFTWSFTIPAGSGAGLYHALYLGAGGTSAVVAQTNGWTDTGNAADATNAGTVYGLSIHGILATGGTAGSLTVTWAASSGTPTTTLTSRSHMVLLRIG